MFEFLRVQYRLNRLDDAGLYRYVQAGCISEEQCRKILKEE